MSGNFGSAFAFLADTLVGLYVMAVLLRFVLQWRRADFYNPLSQFVVVVTNPLLKPLRRVIPGWRGLDIAALVLAYLISLLLILSLGLILHGAVIPAPWLLYYGLLKLLVLFLQLYFFTIIIQALLSWVSPGGYNPVAMVLFSVNEPLLRPFRRILPPMGGFDLSPLFALILLQFLIHLIPLPLGLR